MLEAIIGLIFATILIYVFGKLSEIEYPSEGYMFTVYPWLTTAPETISTTIYALKGYHTTAIANSIYSATFDFLVAFGLATLVHGENEVKTVDLGFLSALSVLVFLLLDFDAQITRVDGFVLYAVLFALMMYSIYVYGLPSFKGFRGFDVARVLTGLLGLGFSSFLFAKYVMDLIPYVGEMIAGVISASLTSVPDMVVALIYGMTTPYSQSQIFGCIAHDFVENIATASVVAGLIVDANPVATFAVVATTVAMMLVTLSHGRITKFEAILIIIAYIVASLFII